jgi:predicted regulator of Ras-like GTPase activity (Roadblock/LC7/MglB family)
MKIDVSKLDDRIAKCQKILEDDPNSQIFAALAEAYRKKGMVKKAFEVCHNGLEKHPDYGSAYLVLAKVLVDQGDYIEANHYLQKAISVSGRTRSVDILESEILIKLGQPSKARNILEKLYRSDPRNETIRSLFASIDKELVPLRVVAAQPGVSEPKVKRAYTLSNALSIIKILPRVLGVVAVAKDGIVVEGHFDGMLSRDELGALASAAYDSTVQGIAKIDFGEVHEILVESDKSKLWIINRGNFILVICTRDDANMGSLRFKVNEILGKMENS